jgi:hypothetical protein
LLMLLFIFRPVVVGVACVREWRFETALLVACGVVWTVTGCVTVVSAIWLLLSRGCSQAPMLIGGGAIIACGASFATAATTHVLPCGGPD